MIGWSGILFLRLFLLEGQSRQEEQHRFVELTEVVRTGLLGLLDL